ncbi:uncharacterized protein (DUF58 family) [Kineococcus xinjiangensis]|uniref:Uncharacterized protein (DUF58 family) n=1 Tax=Kineococcus xinjiangensis TaxID=512762 RepID=A0A2S6IU91_9ACTN|nr:uncharacterized protein (DUF58 family) [Kineococcus xinjiangensis]
MVLPRAAVVALLGLLPVVLVPGWRSVVVWALVLVLLLLVDLALAASPRKLRLEREVPPSVRLGEVCHSLVTVTNAGSRRARGLLRDAWQPSAGARGERHRVDLPPGERRRAATALRPTRRGERSADRVTVRLSGPLGLAARQASLVLPGRLRVLPAFSSRRHLPSRMARLRELDGRTAVLHRGQGTEFDSLRDYVDGDDVRSIDWRATARRQTVVVRTWRPERDRRVLIVLDASRTAAARIGHVPGTGPDEPGSDEVRLDAAIEASLLLGALASRAGDRVDLLAHSRTVRARVKGASRTRLLNELVEALAPLEADLVETDWDAVVAEVRATARQRCLVVLLTALDSAAVEVGLLPALAQLTARYTVVLASVDDPSLRQLAAARSDIDEVYAAAAAEAAGVERAATAELLARLGVEVVHAPPHDLAPALADRYLDLKAAGRL